MAACRRLKGGLQVSLGCERSEPENGMGAGEEAELSRPGMDLEGKGRVVWKGYACDGSVLMERLHRMQG